MPPQFRRIAAGDVAMAEVVADGIVVASAGDALQLFLDAGAEAIVLRAEQLAPEFFRLASGLAGEVAQKCENYGLRLAVVGDFDGYESRSLRAFIVESNRTGRVLFAPSLDEALQRLSGGRA